MAQPPKKKPKRQPEPLNWKELAAGPALRGLTEVLATPADAAKDRAARRLALDQSRAEGFPAPAAAPAKAMAMPASPYLEETPTEEFSPTEVVSHSVGESATVPPTAAPEWGSSVEIVTPTVDETPAVVESPAVPVAPTEGKKPTVGDIATAKRASLTRPIEGVSPPAGQTSTVGDTDLRIRASLTRPIEGVSPPAGQTATVGVLPSHKEAGDPPTVGESNPVAATHSQPTDYKSDSNEPSVGVSSSVDEKPDAGDLPTEGDLPTVGGVVTWKSPASSSRSGGQKVTTAGHSATVGVTQWVDAHGATYESRKVLRVQIAQHCMTLGEERFYQSVWHAREADGVRRDGPRSKVFSMGYDRLAKLVRLDEKSVRQLIPKLVAKRVLEVLANEDSSARIGRTYRIFNYDEILERQQAENMLFVIKKGRAVEFVWPVGETAVVRPTVGVSPTVGMTSSVGYDEPAELAWVKASGNEEPETSPVQQALSQYATADGEAARMIAAGARRNAPDATTEEIVHFIHEKGRLARAGKMANPLAYLLVYVPKCFAGDGFRRFRQELRQARLMEEAAARQAREDLAQLRGEWQAWLSDPRVPEEDKAWARRMLAGN